jgi:hypothetical protein
MNPVMATPHFKMNLWNYTPDILLSQPIFLSLNQFFVTPLVPAVVADEGVELERLAAAGLFRGQF